MGVNYTSVGFVGRAPSYCSGRRFSSTGDDSVGADRPLVYKRVGCCCGYYYKPAFAAEGAAVCTAFDSIQPPGVGLVLL